MKKRSNQHGLFDSDKDIRAREDSASRRERYEKTLASLQDSSHPLSTRYAILRGFLCLHFAIDNPEETMGKKLAVLGGKTLGELIENHWNVVLGWMREINLYRAEKEKYLEEVKPLTNNGSGNEVKEEKKEDQVNV